MKRIATISTIASGILCGLLLVLLPASYHLTLSSFDSQSSRLVAHNSIAITSHSRSGISDGGLWFFSLECPYTGSIRHIADEQGILCESGHARLTRDRSWIVGDFGFVQESFIGEKGEFVGRDRSGDLPGIYYRHLVWWKQVRPWWTLRVSLWYPILLFAVLPVVWIVRRRGLWLRKKMPNQVLHLTRPARSGCNPHLPPAGSLSLGR